MQNINSILKEKARTSVFVAHRLRTIYDSDTILVLKEGRVAEMGSHRELLDLNGIYAELWNGEFLSLSFPFTISEIMLMCCSARNVPCAGWRGGEHRDGRGGSSTEVVCWSS